MDATLLFFGWGSIAVIIMLYATDDMIMQEANLRFTLVGQLSSWLDSWVHLLVSIWQCQMINLGNLFNAR